MTSPLAPDLTGELLEIARAELASTLQVLDEMMAIPSHASAPGGTDQVAALIVPRLEALDFSCEVIEQGDSPEELAWVEEIMMSGQRQRDLGATYRLSREGSGERRILLLGDLDTAFPEEAHRAFPVRREGNLYFGPGAADMRGGLAVMISALEAIVSVGVEAPSLDVVLSADEQAGSLGSRQVIEAAASVCEWTLCVECSRRGGKLMAARGHIGVGDLVASGVESHAGSAHEDGVNALDLLARVIPPLNALSDHDTGSLVTVTMAEAGRRRSVIPGLARATLDVRAANAAEWDRLVSAIDETVAINGEGRVAVRTYAHRPGVVRTAGTEILLELIQGRAREIGVGIEAFDSAAAGSSAFAAKAGSIVMDGMGPTGGGLMTTDEHIDVASIPERGAILAATILSLGRASPGASGRVPD